MCADLLLDGIIEQTETLRVAITRIFYNENGRVIAEVAVRAGQSLNSGKKTPFRMSILGDMASPCIGQEYEVCGPLTWNSQYRRHQMQFESYRTILPDDSAGVIDYLINIAKWVGPTHAKELVDLFGDNTLKVLKESPDKVFDKIKGLTDDRVKQMQQSLLDNEAIETATIEINNMIGGILGPRTAKKAIKKWKCDAPSLIKSNPFILTSLPGIAFRSADAIHGRLGGVPADPNRHDAALVEVLSVAASSSGHTTVPRQATEMQYGALLNGGSVKQSTSISGAIQRCVQQDKVVIENDSLQLCALKDAEQYIACKLADMLKNKRDAQDTALWPTVPRQELADDQVQATQLWTDAPVFILTGAPGTGKTYTTARIIKALRDCGASVALCAPTGKAAKQMSLALESVGGGNARTIHSVLEPQIDPDTGEFVFQRDEDNQLSADCIVADEYSMVDARLAKSLLSAIPANSRLLIVGDHYQLPSVGPGAVLRDLLAAGVPSYELTQIKRNAGRIVKACHAIKDGKEPSPTPDDVPLDCVEGENWRHVYISEPTSIIEVVKELIKGKLHDRLQDIPHPEDWPLKNGFDPIWDCQVISPTNERGPLSCDVLNRAVRDILNPAAEPIKGLPFSVSDKVVRLRNAVVKGRYVVKEEDEVSQCAQDEVPIVNGDIGIVQAIEKREIVVAFRYPDRIAKIPRAEHQLKLAYCMTCHKMQGSEVPIVLLPLHQGMAGMPIFNREWLYTAMSRAKVLIITIGDLAVMGRAISRVGNRLRSTSLEARLTSFIKEYDLCRRT